VVPRRLAGRLSDGGDDGDGDDAPEATVGGFGYFARCSTHHFCLPLGLALALGLVPERFGPLASWWTLPMVSK